MPESYSYWRCGKCRQTHFSYEHARACEIGHEVKESVDRVSEAIKACFSDKKVRAHLTHTEEPNG